MRRPLFILSEVYSPYSVDEFNPWLVAIVVCIIAIDIVYWMGWDLDPRDRFLKRKRWLTCRFACDASFCTVIASISPSDKAKSLQFDHVNRNPWPWHECWIHDYPITFQLSPFELLCLDPTSHRHKISFMIGLLSYCTRYHLDVSPFDIEATFAFLWQQSEILEDYRVSHRKILWFSRGICNFEYAEHQKYNLKKLSQELDYCTVHIESNSNTVC